MLIDQYLVEPKGESVEYRPLPIGHLQGIEIVETTVVRCKRDVFGETEFETLVRDVYETGIPVEDGEQVVDHDDRAKQIGIVRVPLGSVEERPETVDFHQTENTNDRPEADGEVEEV